MTVGEVQFRLHYYDLVSVVAGWNAALGEVVQLRGKSNFILQNKLRIKFSNILYLNVEVTVEVTVCILIYNCM